MFALTNFGVQNFDYATTVYPFLNEFDRLYVSGRMKNGETSYLQSTRWSRRIAGIPHLETLLFADDRIDNIETARARGWQTHHFNRATGVGGPVGCRRAVEPLKKPPELRLARRLSRSGSHGLADGRWR